MAILSGFKVAILVATGFQVNEMTMPRKALEDAGAKTYLIAPEKIVKGWDWYIPKETDEFTADVLTERANAADYDALFIPGGIMGPDDLRIDEKAIAFVKGFAHKPIATICHGIVPLIDAGLVANRKVTAWRSVKVDLINAGAQWFDKEVIRDGLLVTSRMPEDIPAFNKTMIECFSQFARKDRKPHKK